MTITQLQRIASVRSQLASGEAKKLRLNAGLSLSEVAAPCGVDGSTVWRWEQGRRVPRGTTALAYERVLRSLASAVAS